MEQGLIFVGVLLLLALIVGGWIAAMYNALVRVKNACDESWADIETELKRRYNLIPNLVNTVKGYATHEKETFERVIQARNSAAAPHASLRDQAADENLLTGALQRLFALAEAYPDLKANQNFLGLQQELTVTEDRIQRSRRFYNANVRDLNNRVETFPSNVIANMFGFQKREFFEIEDPAVRAVPEVKF